MKTPKYNRNLAIFDTGSKKIIGNIRALSNAVFAFAIGEMGDATRIELLTPLLEKQNYFVISHAAYALGTIGDTSALELLTPLLRNEHEFIRETEYN